MAEESNNKAIGRVSATEKDPTTSEKFCFWLSPDVDVNPFDIVEGQHEDESKTYGLVTTLEHTTDAPSHLANFVSNNFGQLTEEPNTPRQGTTIAKVNVMKNSTDKYMPLRNESSVKFPDKDGIEIALGIDTMPAEERIAAGLIKLSNNAEAVAYIDRRYTLGPQSAHVNISGISGLATKTSYAMFLIQSMLQTENSQEVAVVLMNVKHGDLLHIHEPNGSLAEKDRKLWEAIGLKCKPFEQVSYLLPRKKDGYGPNSHNPPSSDSYNIYAYDFPDTVDKLDLLFSNISDPANTIESIIGEISTSIDNGVGAWSEVKTWEDLISKSPLVDEDGNPKPLAGMQKSSVGRFRRQLRRIVDTRQTGIFVSNKSKDEVSLGHKLEKDLTGGKTFVVDIALVSPEEQTLVFGDVIRTIYTLFSEADEKRQKTLPKKVIIFVDELNKFAPAREQTSPLIDQILDITERGRSLGIILISAQQFASAVHPRVTGNSVTKVFGRTGSSEITASIYREFDDELKESLTRLRKGELILHHPVYRQPVKIIFPWPAYNQD